MPFLMLYPLRVVTFVRKEWLLSCENALDITGAGALARHRILGVDIAGGALALWRYPKFAQYTSRLRGSEDAASFNCVAPSD
jgi:hypothetical protein